MTRFLMPATTLTTLNLKKTAFTLLCCTVLMVFAAPAQTLQQIKADPGANQGPPAGAILDLASPPQAIPGGGNGTYQPYAVNFTAGIANTAITFAFRDDPAFISFANASVTDVTAGSNTNLLTNGNFSGGTYTNNGNSSTPIGWTYANIYGATFGGIVQSGCGIDGGYCWYDGAVQAYDAISQTIATTVGHTYHISFLVAEDSSCVTDGGGPTCNFSDVSTNGNTSNTGGNGINVTVYAQAGLPGVSQTQTLHPGVTAVYPAGNDNSKWTPSNNQGGELLTVTAVPILRSVFDATPPVAFPGESCVPYADFSAANGGQDTCVEFQAVCAQGTASSNDCETFLYQLTTNYDLPPDQSAIGGPDFLVLHGATCPQSSLLNQSIFLEYGVDRIDPHTTAGGGGISCFVATFRPGAPPITGTGTTVSKSQFVGWESPVVDNQLNLVKAGSTRPLKFQWFDPPGSPNPNLTWCPNTAGTGCTAPWVNLQYFFVPCSAQSGNVVNTATDISSPGNSGFQNLGGGNYQMNWQTMKSWKGSCANVEATFSNGLVVMPATPGFQFN